jgi:tetratricopeptide (TPR) repeat protein
VAIDRDTTLRKAEKFLRQGRLDNAIAEYARVVQEYPRDWKTINILGDLFVRAGQIESAVDQYARIAEHLATEGFLSKAAAVYKKIVKIKPGDENALLKSAEIFEQQGLLAETKSMLSSLAEQRRRRGDRRGSAEIALRLGKLDPLDPNTGLNAARAAVELGDSAAAVRRFKEVAGILFERGKTDDGRKALVEAVELDPSDAETRTSLWKIFLDSGDLEQALEYATTGEQFRAVAAELTVRGREEEALEALAEAVKRDPADVETRTRLARSYVAGGDLERGRSCLLAEPRADAAESRLVLAEIDLRSGRLESGRELLQKVLEVEPARREELVLLGCRICEFNADGAFQCIDVATDAAVKDEDWPAAASALQEFVTRVPNHIPALMKLVEICVDGRLEGTMYSAQAQLADAYLGAGCPTEARVIAEDLVAREPWERANIERFRRALTMLGEPDVDAIIAERLSGDSPFLSTGFALDLDLEELTPDGPAAAEKATAGGVESDHREGDHAEGDDTAPAAAVEISASTAPDVGRPTGEQVLEIRGQDVELTAPLSEQGSKAAAGEPFEIDLSKALDELGDDTGDAISEGATVEEAARRPAATQSLEEAFESFRDDAAAQGSTDSATQHYRLALTYRDMGMIEESLKALEVAARSPRYRFDAASRLGRAARERGMIREAVEWFERAAEAPAPDAAAGRDLLYDLGRTLAEAGETERALAVFLELQADAPDYPEVGVQVERLLPRA